MRIDQAAIDRAVENVRNQSAASGKIGLEYQAVADGS
jgi:hypothetical protein